MAEGIVLRVGGQPREQLLGSLAAAGVQLNAHAQTLLADPAFDDPPARTVRVVQRSVAQLGLPDGGTLPQVLAAAAEHDLDLCPLVTGPALRLALADQAESADSVLSAGRAPDGAIHVLSAPLSESVEHPKGFYLRVVDGVRWLRGYRCDDTYVLEPDQQLALVLPASPQTSAAADERSRARTTKPRTTSSSR